MVKNIINQSNYLAEFRYYGEDDEVNLLVDKLKEFNTRHTLILYFKSRISFTGDKINGLFKALQNRKLQKISIGHYLDREETRLVLDFLSSPDVSYSKYYLAIDTEDAFEALKAVQNRFLFNEGWIYTQQPVSKEAEELALSILDSHYDCSLLLNSEVKALKQAEKRSIERIYPNL